MYLSCFPVMWMGPSDFGTAIQVCTVCIQWNLLIKTLSEPAVFVVCREVVLF